jgi:hypothetical protein
MTMRSDIFEPVGQGFTYSGLEGWLCLCSKQVLGQLSEKIRSALVLLGAEEEMVLCLKLLAEGAVVGGGRSRDVASGTGGEMAMDETGNESCLVWLVPLPGSLEGFQIDFLHCLGFPLVATLEIVE